jgi:hypothetical protein
MEDVHMITWRNGMLLIGRDVLHGPPYWLLGLYWNRREDIPGEPPPDEGDLTFMDAVEWRIKWPRAWRSR